MNYLVRLPKGQFVREVNLFCLYGKLILNPKYRAFLHSLIYAQAHHLIFMHHYYNLTSINDLCLKFK